MEMRSLIHHYIWWRRFTPAKHFHRYHRSQNQCREMAEKEAHLVISLQFGRRRLVKGKYAYGTQI